MDKLRMVQWLLIAALLYLAAMHVAQPQFQIVLWKTGHITVAAFAGYWIDRAAARKRLTHTSPGSEHMRRAIIISAAMLAVSMGM